MTCETTNYKLQLIAEATRTELETFARENKHIGNPINLMCFCAIGAYTLWNVCKRQGYKHIEFVAGEFIDYSGSYSYHCWNESESSIVDITATQFKFIYDRVYFPSSKGKSFYIKDGYFFKNTLATRKINEEWEPKQNIKNNREGINKMIKNSCSKLKKTFQMEGL